MPRLAASAQNARNSPAPKLAGYNASTPPTVKQYAQSTPQLQPVQYSQPTTEPKHTPVTKFVSNNITPRSSSRKSRASSAHSTPGTEGDATPSRSRPSSILSFDAAAYSKGAGISERSESDLNRLKQTASLQSNNTNLITNPRSSQSPERVNDATSTIERQSPFFYASDRVRSENPPTRPQHKKQNSFVYANGSSRTSVNDKETNEAKASLQGKPPSVVRPTDLAISPTMSTGGQRRPSPPRSGFHLTYRKGISQVLPPQPLSPPVSEYFPRERRSPSIDESIDKRASRTFSSTSHDHTAGDSATKKENGFPFLSMFSVGGHSPVVSPDSTNRNSALLAHGDPDRPQSPPSAVGSSESDPNRSDAAAHARRERKIMDLEISNSSLLVINRSLEKEIRRQKAELRRFRRLSRKSSLFSDGMIEVSNNRLSLATEDEEDDAEENDMDEESAGEESSYDSFADEPMSPGAIAQRDARHRKSDQRRLQKDLAKHKELLGDSQRMNQSLRRCLNVTEQLISDANKALEYQVSQDEVRLGGRVLSPEEQNHDLLSRAATPFSDEASQVNGQSHNALISSMDQPPFSRSPDGFNAGSLNDAPEQTRMLLEESERFLRRTDIDNRGKLI